MQVTPSASTYAPGDLASPPAADSARLFPDQPRDNAGAFADNGSGDNDLHDSQYPHADPAPASTSLFALTDHTPSTILTQMVLTQTKPLLVTPENAAGLGINLVHTKPLLITFEKEQCLKLSEPGVLNVQEANLLHPISRAARSAVKIAGSDDPTAGFASDFSRGVLGDKLQGVKTKGYEQSQDQNQVGKDGQQRGKPSSDWVKSLGLSEVDAKSLGRDGMSTDTRQWIAEPAGQPALTAGDFARMDRAGREAWALKGGAVEAFGTALESSLPDSMQSPGQWAESELGDRLVPGAFSHRLYDNVSIESELTRKLNLHADGTRLHKMAYVDPMGSVWGSARDIEITDSFESSVSPIQGTPNKYEGYDLGTAEGMKNFVVDVSLARALNMQLPDDMVATARTIASAYFGENGSLNQTARNILRTNDQILSDRFATNAGRIVTYQALNEKFGTNIDFSAVAQFEGGQMLKGYVPMSDGRVLGRSGVTIATGYDIGQMNKMQLKELGFAKDLEDRLRPYTSLTKTDAVDFLNNNPLSVTRAEAMQIDFAVKAMHLGAAIQAWNDSDPTENFADLTRAQQTVLFSRTFHQGVGMPATSVAQGFYSAALQGRWVQAETALRAYDVTAKWYKSRVGAEANLLLKERSK
ncbi:pesticin C-terminus-like muramidase [Acidovorax sp.]|uniref:pesticin C-terminus-like muramidase n=1 Tax=Acidovorax sp. TaxID=1872122 RepID=UPI0027B8B91B|nr:pesticin C-terminus-like muramidase [Acidovorax sp.]